jgi:DnaJ-domain-containing protein 1
MDRFFDRLGDVIKNFLDDEDENLFGPNRRSGSFGDPDLDAAYDELDEFLKTGKNEKPAGGAGSSAGTPHGGAWSDPREAGGERTRRAGAAKAPVGVPETLRKDFAELGLPLGASEESCKAAYKKLLKLHHPDRHAGHAENMKKATEKSSRINAAYQRIEHWRETGRTE